MDVSHDSLLWETGPDGRRHPSALMEIMAQQNLLTSDQKTELRAWALELAETGEVSDRDLALFQAQADLIEAEVVNSFH